MNRQSTEGFSGSEGALDDTVMVGACRGTFVQTTECTNPSVTLQVNCGL